MLALAVSCETMYGPVQTPIASDEKKADGVEITVTEAKDESVIFTLAPKAESAYYSYMVHQANEAVEVDAQSLYSGAYKGKAGVVKTGSSAENPFMALIFLPLFFKICINSVKVTPYCP